jgi:hypothetical protein
LKFFSGNRYWLATRGDARAGEIFNFQNTEQAFM